MSRIQDLSNQLNLDNKLTHRRPESTLGGPSAVPARVAVNRSRPQSLNHGAFSLRRNRAATEAATDAGSAPESAASLTSQDDLSLSMLNDGKKSKKRLRGRRAAKKEREKELSSTGSGGDNGSWIGQANGAEEDTASQACDEFGELKSKGARRRANQFSPKLERVPLLVAEILNYMRARDEILSSEGIFRLSGRQADVQALKKAYDKGSKVQLQRWADIDVNNLSGALKLYFRELPEPLLTFALYEAFMAAAGLPEASDRFVAIRKVVDRLPPGNRTVFLYLVEFLREVAALADRNKMTASNLAVVFAPTLLRPEVETIDLVFGNVSGGLDLLTAVIGDYDKLFGSNSSLVGGGARRGGTGGGDDSTGTDDMPLISKEYSDMFDRILSKGTVRLRANFLQEAAQLAAAKVAERDDSPAGSPTAPPSAIAAGSRATVDWGTFFNEDGNGGNGTAARGRGRGRGGRGMRGGGQSGRGGRGGRGARGRGGAANIASSSPSPPTPLSLSSSGSPQPAQPERHSKAVKDGAELPAPLVAPSEPPAPLVAPPAAAEPPVPLVTPPAAAEPPEPSCIAVEPTVRQERVATEPPPPLTPPPSVASTARRATDSSKRTLAPPPPLVTPPRPVSLYGGPTSPLARIAPPSPFVPPPPLLSTPTATTSAPPPSFSSTPAPPPLLVPPSPAAAAAAAQPSLNDGMEPIDELADRLLEWMVCGTDEALAQVKQHLAGVDSAQRRRQLKLHLRERIGKLRSR
jgi:RhoGAP domain